MQVSVSCSIYNRDILIRIQHKMRPITLCHVCSVQTVTTNLKYEARTTMLNNDEPVKHEVKQYTPWNVYCESQTVDIVRQMYFTNDNSKYYKETITTSKACILHVNV